MIVPITEQAFHMRSTVVEAIEERRQRLFRFGNECGAPKCIARCDVGEAPSSTCECVSDPLRMTKFLFIQNDFVHKLMDAVK